jgi:hypothetical protein
MSYPGPFFGMEDSLHNTVFRLRKAVMEFEGHLQESGTIVTAWLSLDEPERKRHLFYGIKETCEHVTTHYDGRALCLKSPRRRC